MPPNLQPRTDAVRLSLVQKLFLYTSGTLVVLLLATLAFLERNQARQWDDYLQAQSIAFARFATPELLKLFRGTFPPPHLDELGQLNEFLGINRDLVEFELISPGGRLLYRSPRFTAFADLDLSSLDDGKEEVPGPAVSARTRLLPGGHRLLDLVTPAFGPTGAQVLAVRYLISYDSVDARLAGVRWYFLRVGLGAVFGSLVLAALVARRVTRPLLELTAAAHAVARGELQTRLPVRSGDEIGVLAGAFNRMGESLAASRGELTEKNAALLRANEELRQMQEHLLRSERLAAIGQLAAGVSHEIDNPVGIILGYAELLYEDLAEGDPRRDDVRAIIEECKRCKRITGGLLGFARSASGPVAALALKPLVEQTLESLRPQKLFREVELRLLAPQAPQLVGDADQLRQVLVNLLLNAAQAMGGRGTVTVTLRREEDRVLLEVADTGPGVPPELRERIFEPFFSTKRSGEGTGLGLAVCRKLVEEHGGRLTLVETTAGGASFRIELPLAPPEKSFDNPSADSLG